MGIIITEETCEQIGVPKVKVHGVSMEEINDFGYLIYGPERLSLSDAAKRAGLSEANAEKYREYYVQYRNLFEKGYYVEKPPPEYVGEKSPEIIVPAWNDVIHIAGPPSYTSYELATIKDVWTRYDVIGWTPPRIAEYMDMSLEKVVDYLAKYRELQYYEKKKLQAALDLQKSPTPEIAKNLGILMTAIDDVQDFTTTVGVIARILGRVFKPAELLAIGSFTVGEFLNRLTLMNKLTGSEKAVVCHMVKTMKHSSRHSTIKTDVEKRMKRLFPSKGELMEVAQTTDTLFGVGISFGPLIGIAEDAIFGFFKGAPIRFKEWEISDREKAVLSNIWDRIQHPEKGFEAAFKDIAKYAESASNLVVTGDYHGWNEFATGLVTSVYTGVKARCTGVKDAVMGIWELISGRKAAAKKKTKTETRLLLQRVGIDPYGQDSWPVPGLGATATIQEIMDAYSAQAQKVLEYWRAKLGVSDEGLFLDACVKEIGLHASTMFTAEHGVITEGLDPSLLIYIHALENNLNPPPETSNEKFREWHDWIYEEMTFLDVSVPTLEIPRLHIRSFFLHKILK